MEPDVGKVESILRSGVSSVTWYGRISTLYVFDGDWYLLEMHYPT